MRVKGIVDEDFGNYKKCSMFIIFPTCNLKCDRENHNNYCQNSSLLKEKDIEISYQAICERYLANPLSHSLVLGGLEPFDSFDDLINLIITFRYTYQIHDDIVIYTGYTEQELQEEIAYMQFKHCLPVIIKFGRFRPNQEFHHDDVLGVDLANSEQYAKWVKMEI